MLLKRKQTRWWNPQVGPVSISILLVLLHVVLKEILARFDIVSSILVTGSDAPLWMLICAGGFLIIRIAVFLLVPLMLIWRAVVEIAYRIQSRDLTKTSEQGGH